MVEPERVTKAGRFITLEGGEGTGKSTLIQGLRDALEHRGLAVLVTREPGGTPLAECVRTLALSPPDDLHWSPLAHALLMNTSREDHLTKHIRPALAAGTWVLCDRFADSTRAYQSIDGVESETLMQIERLVVGETRPDLTLVLDAAPEALADRRSARGVSDVFEAKDMAFHRQVREAFLEIAKSEPDRCAIVDALQSPAQVLADAIDVIDVRLRSE